MLASQQPVEDTLRQGRKFLSGHTNHLAASAHTELDTKMVSLEIRWMRLQRESDNRYRRLVVIHEKLSAFEEVVHPFVVRIHIYIYIYIYVCVCVYVLYVLYNVYSSVIVLKLNDSCELLIVTCTSRTNIRTGIPPPSIV